MITVEKFDSSTTIHPSAEFGSLPWDLLKEDGGVWWSVTYGGYHLGSDAISIQMISADRSSDVWVMPPILAAIIRNHADAKESLLHELRSFQIGS